MQKIGSNKIIFYLIVIMAGIVVAVLGIADRVSYTAVFEQKRSFLAEMAHSKARDIEAVARFDAQHSQHDHPGGASAATLSQFAEAHKKYEGFGETGEFTLARLENGNIIFLFSHRFEDDAGTKEKHAPVPMSNKFAVPMQLALAGKSGTIVGLDYRGETVLAAYEPINMPDQNWDIAAKTDPVDVRASYIREGLITKNWGIVAKIDLVEVRAPFIRAGLISGGSAIGIILFGALLFLRISNPLIRKLEESEERHRAVMEYAADGIITIDEKGIVDSFNPAAERIFGYQVGEVIERNVSMLMPEPHRSKHDGYIRRYLGEKEKRILCAPNEIVGQRKDGSVFPISLLVSEMYVGSKRMFIGIVRDITKRRESEMELRKLSAAVKQSASSIVITDTEGNIEYVNPAFLKITGYSSAEVLGQNPRLLNGGETPPEVYKDIWETILAGKVWYGDLLNKKKNGKLFLEKTVIAPIRDSEGVITHFLATKEDITGQKKTEEALQAKKVAEEISRQKSEFLASMSHELRNPLNAVIGFSRRIPAKIENGQFEKAKQQAKDIESAGTYLLNLINEILDYAKIEAGMLELNREHFSIREIIDNIRSQLSFQVEEKGIKLTIEIPENLPLIFADRIGLTKIIINLFSNAVKFTPKGGEVKIATAANSEIVLVVKDNGIGITPDDQEVIFERFQQVGRSRREQRGTGLGLAITKRLVELHGGQIEVQSKVGQGTSFRVLLPIS